MSHAADLFAFLIHKVVCFSFVYALIDFVELFVTLVHVLYMSCEKVSYGLFVGFKRFTKLGLL